MSMLFNYVFRSLTTNRLLIILMLSASFSMQAFPQAAAEENIKKFVKLEIEAFLRRDAKLWEELWLHDDKTTRTLVSSNSYYSKTGWNSFGPRMLSFLKSQSKPVEARVATDSFKIRNYNNLAWVEYNLTVAGAGADSVNRMFTREYRFLLKEKGNWKIVSQVSLSPEMFALTPQTIEDNINTLAFKLLDDKNIEAALDMFRVNIKLYPNSWHAYDSIGEAYATIGKKDEAIQNYKKSLALNPANLNGKTALEKLQSQ